MTTSKIPYGFWPSDWTAEKAASAGRDYAEIRAGHGGLFWIEYDPADTRCTLWYWRAGQAICITPSDVSLRSRVYEYGGGAFCLTDRGVAFVNERDQQIHLQSVGEVAEPVALTQRADCRYGDLQFDPWQAAIVAVEEDHAGEGVQHRLVSFSVGSGQRSILAEGADFYSSPALDSGAKRMAWIQWQRPEQPWTATSLWMAERDTYGTWQAPKCLAGAEGGESLQQPRFAVDGTLYCLSDRAGWWQPWREQGSRLVPALTPANNESWPAAASPAQLAFDHAPAPWQLGMTSYLPLPEGCLLLTRMVDGYGLLLERDAGGYERQLATSFSRCRQLAADEQHFYCIAAAPDRVSAVLTIDRRTGLTDIIAGGEQPLPADQLSRPEPFSYATGREETTHAFFYPPRNAGCQSLEGEKPPLVVFLHGGPTSACYPVFDPRIQYWTQRGFAVVDLNYRGSSGFGRAYRQRLHGQWGVVDVEDARTAVTALAVGGQIDPARTFIRGSSAGGYTALCTLAANAGFSGGASLYGVSDPLALRRVTHKFEADYLDWLIGDPERHAERYRQRTPLRNAAQISVPVIFFQGGRDAVVLPEQTESMVAALRQGGVPVEYWLYPEERHGFRQASNLVDALKRECLFYRGLLR